MSFRAVVKSLDSLVFLRIRRYAIVLPNRRYSSDKHSVHKSEESETDLSQTKVTLKDQNGNILGVKTVAESKLLAKKMRMNLIEEKNALKRKYKVFKLVSNYYLAQNDSQSEEMEIKSEDNSWAKSAKEVKRLVFSTKLDANDLMTKINQIKRWLSRGHQIAISVVNPKNDTKIVEEIYNTFEKELKGIAKLNQKKIKSDKSLKFMIVSTIESKDQLNEIKSKNHSNISVDTEDMDPNKLLSEEFEQELEKNDFSKVK